MVKVMLVNKDQKDLKVLMEMKVEHRIKDKEENRVPKRDLKVRQVVEARLLQIKDKKDHKVN